MKQRELWETQLGHDRTLIPEEEVWGPGFGDQLLGEYLDEVVTNITETQQPGYGPRVRFRTANLHWLSDLGRIIVPAGYDAIGHPNRHRGDPETMDPDRKTSTEAFWQMPQVDQEAFRLHGWELDQHGRACNPNALHLLTHPRIGLNTGVGYGYFVGEAMVVDVIPRTRNGFVHIYRGSADQPFPALIGGYVVPGDYGYTAKTWKQAGRPVTLEGLYEAARCKLWEKAGIPVPPGTPMKAVRAIRPTSSPHTLNFWTTTVTFVVEVAEERVNDLDDRLGATLVHENQLDVVLDHMWPDHRRAAEAAFA